MQACFGSGDRTITETRLGYLSIDLLFFRLPDEAGTGKNSNNSMVVLVVAMYLDPSIAGMLQKGLLE